MIDENDTHSGLENRHEINVPAQLAEGTVRFSSWDENLEHKSEVSRITSHLLNRQELAPVYKSSSSLEQYLENCRRSAEAISLSKADSDRRARAHLINIATLVLSDEFDLEMVGRLLGRKVTLPSRKNPFRFIMEAFAPAQDNKFISKQALALQFAVTQSNGNIDELRRQFQDHSINEYYQNYLEGKKEERRLSGRPVRRPARMVISGVPAGLQGEVTVRLQIVDGEAQFLSLVDLKPIEGKSNEVPATIQQEGARSPLAGFGMNTDTTISRSVNDTPATAEPKDGNSMREADLTELGLPPQNLGDQRVRASNGMQAIKPEGAGTQHLPLSPRPFGQVGIKTFQFKE